MVHDAFITSSATHPNTLFWQTFSILQRWGKVVMSVRQTCREERPGAKISAPEQLIQLVASTNLSACSITPPVSSPDLVVSPRHHLWAQDICRCDPIQNSKAHHKINKEAPTRKCFFCWCLYGRLSHQQVTTLSVCCSCVCILDLAKR